ncbi:MAG: ShlB/FhaC/HecB family hemolysin secretion/activation protein [Aquabacterium sp.]
MPQPAAALRELGKPSDEMSIDVARFVVDDSAPEALRRALPEITRAFVGKGKSYEDLVNAANSVTRYLQRELGFYLGYAFLPEQEPKDGVIRIAILEGRLDQIVLNWPGELPVKREVVEQYLALLKPGDILRVRDVERVVFLINDLRGITARFEVRSGRTPGTASLVVTPAPEGRLAHRVEIDTLGSRYSGEIRVSGLTQVNSPTGRGDGLVLNALTTQTRGLMFGLVGYTLPVGSSGLKIGTSLSFVKYQLDKEELTLDLNGDAATVTVYGLYPVIRSRNLNLFGLLSLDAKSFNDKQGVTGFAVAKKVNTVQLSGSGDARDDYFSGGVNTYDLGLIQGSLSVLNSQLPKSFALMRFSATRLQNLVDNKLLLYAALRGQVAFKNLDTTMKFQLGGADRVRAFAPGEGTGDTGLALSTELRYLPPEDLLGRIAREMVFSAFFDFGTVKLQQQPPTPIDSSEVIENTRKLSGWGIGGVWERPQNFSVRVSLAWPISGKAEADPKVRNPRLYAVVNKSF